MDSERECCSSSNESVLESDNDIYTEESDEEGGAVLVPRKTSSRHGGESQNQTDLVSTAALATEVFSRLVIRYVVIYNTQLNLL